MWTVSSTSAGALEAVRYFLKAYPPSSPPSATASASSGSPAGSATATRLARPEAGSGQIAGSGTGGAAQPLQVGLPLGSRTGRARLRAQAHGDDDRVVASCPPVGILVSLLGLAGGAERGERGHQVDFIGIQREYRAVLALEHADDEGVRFGCRRR